MYTFGQSARLLWGKLRRAFLIAFRKKRVEEMLQRRRGGCSRCGACCKLLFQCPAYDESDGSPKCLIYNDRPGQCGLFPLDEKDLRDRDIVMPERSCGFRFSDDASTARPEPVSLRWGPPIGKVEDPLRNGRPWFLKGVWAILWSSIRPPRKPSDGNGHAGNGTP